MDQGQKDLVYLNIAEQYANFSKCQFTQVACIFVNEAGRVISSGVNGTISGMSNCHEHTFDKRDDHVPYTEKNEIHAEMNAILELARSSSSPKHITVYTTLSPCYNCLKHLVGLVNKNGLQIDRIVFKEKYHRLTEEDLDEMKAFCQRANIRLENINYEN